jgi:protein-disulfide isomerase
MNGIESSPNAPAIILSAPRLILGAAKSLPRALRGDLGRAVTMTFAPAFVLSLIAGRLAAQTPAPLDTRSKGSPQAPVTVYEMSDFQCPYCGQFAVETFPQLERDYIRTGKVRWVFINFPLTSVHQHASAAAQLGVCAAQQRNFWRVHDLLFKYQETWAPLKEAAPFFVSLGDSVGLSKPALLSCLQSNETLNSVRADAEGAARSGATSTPTFYIEGGLLEGAQPIEVFRQVLDSVYKVKGGKLGAVSR